MNFNCEQCGACCKLAWMKVEQGEDLPLKEDGSCGNLVDNNGKYSCRIFEDRPDTCRSSYVQKKYNLDDDTYVELANKARLFVRQIVSKICG